LDLVDKPTNISRPKTNKHAWVHHNWQDSGVQGDAPVGGLGH